MTQNRVPPLNNPLSDKSLSTPKLPGINRERERGVGGVKGAERGGARGGTTNYAWGLKWWVCDKCGIKHGPALFSYKRRHCLFCEGNLKEVR